MHARSLYPQILSLATFLLAGASWAVDFKGIELGEPLWLSAERSVFGTLDCNPMQLDPDEQQSYLLELQQIVPGVRKVCTGTTSIAAIPADATVILGASRRVLRLSFEFPGNGYTQVLDAMTAKWGEGLAEVRDENDESVWWEFDDGASVSIHHTPIAGESLFTGLVEYSLAIAAPDEDL